MNYDDLAIQEEILNNLPHQFFQTTGQIDVERLIQSESVKGMQKRLQKILERAAMIVNKQIGMALQLNSASPANEKPHSGAGEDIPHLVNSSLSNFEVKTSDTGNETLNFHNKNVLFFNEWVAQSGLEWLKNTLSTWTGKKREERDKNIKTEGTRTKSR